MIVDRLLSRRKSSIKSIQSCSLSDRIGLVAVERTSPGRANNTFRIAIDVLNTEVVVPDTLGIGSDVVQPVRFRVDKLQLPQSSNVSALEHFSGGIAVGALVTALGQDTAAASHVRARCGRGVSKSCCSGQVGLVAGCLVELCCCAENDTLVVCENIAVE